MHSLRRGTVLVITLGLLWLAPPVGLAAYHAGRLVNPAALQGEPSRWGRETRSGLAGTRPGNPVDQHRGGVLLAKAPKASKKKG